MPGKTEREKKFEEVFGHVDYRREVALRALDSESEDTEDPDYFHLEGKAVTFNEATVLFKSGGFEYKEIIDRGAFTNADTSDVFLKFNHESSVMAMARTKNGTLELETRDDGVYIKAKLSKRLSAASDLYEAVRSGLIDKMSFAFTISEESFNTETRTWTVRGIDKIYDVAAVEVPAYDNTFIYARRQGDVEARRAAVESAELEQKRALALAKNKAALKTKN